MSKRIKVISPSGRHTILVFYIKHYGNIPTRIPLTGAKIVIFDQLWHGRRSLLDRRVLSTFRQWNKGYSTCASSIFRDQQTPQRYASVNFVYDRKTETFTPKTEHNLIVRSGKSEAEVTNNKRLRWMYCTVEAKTDRHKTPRVLLRQQSFLLQNTVNHYLARQHQSLSLMCSFHCYDITLFGKSLWPTAVVMDRQNRRAIITINSPGGSTMQWDAG